MIQYTKYASDIKKRINALTWVTGRIFIIIAACAMPITLYLFIVGIAAQEADALSMGCSALTLLIVVLVMYLVIYFKYRKIVTLNFYKLAEDGKIEYTLERTEDDHLRFTRLTDEESFEISRNEIRKIKHMKTISIVVLTNKKTVDLPRRPDIEELLNHFC